MKVNFFNVCKGKIYFNKLNDSYFNKKIIKLTTSYYKNKNLKRKNDENNDILIELKDFKDKQELLLQQKEERRLKRLKRKKAAPLDPITPEQYNAIIHYI